MIRIQKPDESCFKLLGPQNTAPASVLRPITFLVQQPVLDGVLLFNNLTKEMVLLSSEEEARFVSNLGSVPELVSHWFSVPEDHDDQLLARQYRKVAKLIAPPVKAITNYTIFTTTDCNARCFYCYELGRARIPMSRETAERVAAFIIEQSKGRQVKLHWFGGEPLFNKPVITLICTRLQESGIEFQSSMISNAFLMNEDTVQEAKDLWKLKKIQITIDGTEAVYNKVKAFISKDANPYRTVIGNIHHLLAADIKVRIRINVDIHNVDSTMALVEELHKEYEGDNNLHIYSHELFDTDHLTFNKQENRRIIYEKRMQIQNKLEEWGFAETPSLSRRIRFQYCMADNDSSVTILPDGHIGKCEHYSDDNWFGHIDSSEYDYETIARFKDTQEEIEACRKCVQYPDCIRLKMCLDIDNCSQEYRDEYIRNTQRAMLNTYEKFKKGELTEKSDDDDPQA